MAETVESWTSAAIQAGGAIAVCGMFLWFLKQKQIADDRSREKFLAHLEQKDKFNQEAMSQQMKYLRERDAQSKEIALNGHAKLLEVKEALQSMQMQISGR